MKRAFWMVLLAVLVLPATAAFGQAAAAPAVHTAATFDFTALGVGLGLGLILIGAGKGIGAIGSHAVDAIARQPEAGGRIFTSMIISAALIEGATLFAIVVAMLAL